MVITVSSLDDIYRAIRALDDRLYKLDPSLNVLRRRLECQREELWRKVDDIMTTQQTAYEPTQEGDREEDI